MTDYQAFTTRATPQAERRRLHVEQRARRIADDMARREGKPIGGLWWELARLAAYEMLLALEG